MRENDGRLPVGRYSVPQCSLVSRRYVFSLYFWHPLRTFDVTVLSNVTRPLRSGRQVCKDTCMAPANGRTLSRLSSTSRVHKGRQHRPYQFQPTCLMRRVACRVGGCRGGDDSVGVLWGWVRGPIRIERWGRSRWRWRLLTGWKGLERCTACQ